jgi:hypothetical protein
MDDQTRQTGSMRTPTRYEIRALGYLGDSWASWFEGLTLCHGENGETVLTGPCVDEAALYGVLMKLRDLGLPLISVRRILCGEETPDERA